MTIKYRKTSVVSFHCYGASQRNRARYEMERDR